VDLSTWGAVATVIAALVVIIGMIITVVVLRRTSRETVEQTRRSAESAALSAAAADRSSKAAEEAVGVNRETAAGVAGRVEADALAKRYQEAATQLGHDKAAVRLAGVYAMGRLADDWPEERQTCVDVLCAYLRMPIHHETTQVVEGEKQVRIAIVRLVGSHLDASRPINWCDCDFDFSYADLPLVEWSEPTFRTRPEFRHARFTDLVSMSNPRFEKGAGFNFGRFEGLVRIQQARISGGDVVLSGSDIRAGRPDHGLLGAGKHHRPQQDRLSWRVQSGLRDRPEPQGRVALHQVLVKPGGAFALDGVDAEGVDGFSISGATCQPGAIINVEPEGSVRLPPTFKEFSGKHIYNDVWKN
jgi:hypothetical protein